MIMYALFTFLALMGLIFLVIGIWSEMNTWFLVGSYIPEFYGFIPESIWFFVICYMIMFFAMVGIFIRIGTSGCKKRFDKQPKTKALFNFLYRDGYSTDLLGDRRVGMGIFDVPNLGVVLDIGRLPSPGSVYRFGDKPIRFALQDINFTGNPKYTNIFSFFTDLGFNNMNELQDVLNGYNPELMAKVWNKLVLYHPEAMEDKFVDNIRNMSRDEIVNNNITWNNKKKQINKELAEIDKIIKERT